ncbi:hypothetical protein QN277_005955 [Acacia crassicarpa]|uniref:F-box protein n=1 Tax=Acacia crassicarpa TaxID=499986 RepID=A0AAE1MBS0_9FABA|nr:hypothetical protein QN277_005955 [Acacia crassicarpa]
MEKSQWSDLHWDLILIITNQLGLIDLLSFRGVCNYWRSAASSLKASAEIESLEPRPWFLLYGETAQCSLLTGDHRMYRIEIPELAESTCLQSFVGWLLLYGKNSKSLAFFCPFSGVKIEIPPCPLISEQSESDLYAAFSSYPTDLDCTVVVVKHNKDLKKMNLCMLRRGESEWTFHEHNIDRIRFAGKIKSIAIYQRAFHFLDEDSTLVEFKYDTMRWINYNIVASGSSTSAKKLNYLALEWINRDSFSSKRNEMKQLLGIDRCSISICGAMILQGDANHHLRSYEFVEEDEEESNKPRRELKGVWLQPRFHQISEDQQRW